MAETVAVLKTDPERGLSEREARSRLAAVGPNQLAARRPEPWWQELRESLTEPLVLVLIAVGVLYAVLGEIEDALTIFVVILGVAVIEIVSETRAKRAISALRTLSAPHAIVVRDAQPHAIAAAELVPGDLVLLEPGNRVPADLRLVETVALRIDEASLTGESVPTLKRADAVAPSETELGDRTNLAFAGTTVAGGKGAGIVIATAGETQLARIATLTEGVREEPTPLQRQLRQLSGSLLWVAVAVSAIVPALGVLLAGQPVQQMLLTGLTLAFATIPEELPILITLVLGLGAYQLARRQAIVKRLRAAETLGSVSVIGTDKTGTLTENRLRVVTLALNGNPETWQQIRSRGRPAGAVLRLVEIGVLANDAQHAAGPDGAAYVGDPTEVAFLVAAEEVGIDVAALRHTTQIVEEYPFDDRRKRMAVIAERNGERALLMKGAPESVLAVCSQTVLNGSVVPLEPPQRRAQQALIDQTAQQGLRVLALAERALGPQEALPPSPEAAEQNLCFLGLVGLLDLPRAEAPLSIATLQAAGIRVLMLTGDHPATARSIALRVGIDASRIVLGSEVAATSDAALVELAARVSVFARITPEHKLRVVQSLQQTGAIVAVTGDGVNDAPALRQADIGVAMGKTGTDVAREAADLVLADDNFRTVAAAVEAGRTLYANLRKAVRYYLAAKVGLIAASFGAVLLHLPVPFAPVQIIVLELFMDLGASTTFVAEPAEGDVMAQPPRDPHRPFLDRPTQIAILAGGLTLGAIVLGIYWWTISQGYGVLVAQASAFAAWMVGHLALAAQMRTERQPCLRSDVLGNRPFLLWIVAAIVTLIAGTHVPWLRDRIHITGLPDSVWVPVIVVGLVAPFWWEVIKWVRWRGPSSHPPVST